MSCSGRHKVVVQGALGCMILLLGFWHIRYSYANKLNNKACTMADSEKAMQTIEKAIKLNPMNPVYYANMGLLYAATDTAINLRNYMALSKMSSMALNQAIVNFHKAESIKPNDGMIYLNLGVLYTLEREQAKAEFYLRKSVKELSDEKSRLLWGIFNEVQNRVNKSRELYTDAVFIAPYLVDTQFYADLLKRDSVLVKCIVDRLIIKMYNNHLVKDPILNSKLGKIQFYNGNMIEADSLCVEALKFSPNMNRAWLLLGNIKESMHDSAGAVNCYDKSGILDESDPLPFYFRTRLTHRTVNKFARSNTYNTSENQEKYFFLYAASLKQETVLMDLEEYLLNMHIRLLQK